MHTSLEALSVKVDIRTRVFQQYCFKHAGPHTVFWPMCSGLNPDTHTHTILHYVKTDTWDGCRCKVSIVFICIVNQGAQRMSNRDRNDRDRNMFSLERILVADFLVLLTSFPHNYLDLSHCSNAVYWSRFCGETSRGSWVAKKLYQIIKNIKLWK